MRFRLVLGLDGDLLHTTLFFCFCHFGLVLFVDVGG
jgi:hypothetical protein